MLICIIFETFLIEKNTTIDDEDKTSSKKDDIAILKIIIRSNCLRKRGLSINLPQLVYLNCLKLC